MAIKFLNINSGEELTAESEPQITALWASSDHSPNVTQGQDFGWRLAPAVLVELKQIKQDPMRLQQIAGLLQKGIEDLGEPDILTYISSKTPSERAPVAIQGDYADAYDQEVRALTKEAQDRKLAEVGIVAGTVVQESLEDLQKRVELEERLARAKTVSGAETTTTTTTVAPANTNTQSLTTPTIPGTPAPTTAGLAQSGTTKSGPATVTKTTATPPKTS